MLLTSLGQDREKFPPVTATCFEVRWRTAFRKGRFCRVNLITTEQPVVVVGDMNLVRAVLDRLPPKLSRTVHVPMQYDAKAAIGFFHGNPAPIEVMTWGRFNELCPPGQSPFIWREENRPK